MFDQKLSADSIYYTENELTALNKKYSSGITWLGADDSTRYGYYLNNDKNTKVYKCIKISPLNDTSASLLKHYGAPEFDGNNTGVLRIPALSKDDSDYNSIGIPPLATDILVTVTTDFGVNVDNAGVDKETSGNTEWKAYKTVGLSGEYSWSYYTNNKFDNEEPQINELSVFVMPSTTVESDTSTYQSIDNTPVFQKEGFTTDIEISKKFNLKSKCLWVKGSVSDSGSGIKSLTAKVYRLNTTSYPFAGDPKVIRDYFDVSLLITGPKGTICTATGDNANPYDDKGVCCKLNNLTEDGFYKVVFYAKDNNDLITESAPYYFIYDVTGPDMGNLQIEDVRKSAKVTSFSWTNPAIPDLAYYQVTTKDITETEKLPDGQSKEADKTGRLTGTKAKETNNEVAYVDENWQSVLLTNQHKYEHHFIFYDYAGNPSDPVICRDDTGPEPSTIGYSFISTQTYKDATRARDIIKVSFTESTSLDYAVGLTTYTTGNNTESITAAKEIKFDDSTRKQTITITDYDYSGNTTTSTVTLESVPKVGMIYYSDGYWGSNYDTYYDSSRTPEGVICYVDESLSKFYIWDIWDQYGYCWGSTDLWVRTEVDSKGIDIYDKLITTFGEEKILASRGMSRSNNGMEVYSDEMPKSPSIWSYAIQKNKEDVPATVKSEKWFFPGRDEFQYIFDNMTKMAPAYRAITQDGHYGHGALEVVTNGETETSKKTRIMRKVNFLSPEITFYVNSTAYMTPAQYWTCNLHWDVNSRKILGAPSEIGTIVYSDGEKITRGLYGVKTLTNIDLEGNGTKKTYYLYHSALDNTAYDGWFYMDRAIRNTADHATNDDFLFDMYTHAMGLVELKD